MVEKKEEAEYCALMIFKIVPKLHMSIGVPYDKPKITSGDR